MADTLLGNLVWKITGDTRDFDKDIAKTDKGIGGLTSKGVASFAKLAAGVGVATAAFFGIKAIVDKTEKAWAEQEEALAILNSTLKATGATAWTSADELTAFASELQGITKYGDETITSMQSVLLGFKNIKGDNFKAATVEILNMATVMKMDLTSAAQAVGKALDDPIRGVDSLSRQGFRFSEEQKEMLKVMVETGKIAEAQGFILDELATTFGGAAEAAGMTASAIKVRLGNAMGDVNEEAGRMITNSLAPTRLVFLGIAEAVSGAIAKYNDYVEAAKASDQGIATAEQRVLVLREEQKALESDARSRMIYDEQGRRVDSAASERIRAQISAIERRITAIQRAAQEEALRERQAAEAAEAARIADELYSKNKAFVLGLIIDERTELQKNLELLRELYAIRNLTGADELARLKTIEQIKNRNIEIENEALDAEIKAKQKLFDDEFAAAKETADYNNRQFTLEQEQNRKRLEAIAAQQNAVAAYFGQASSLLSAFGNLSAAISAQEIAQLDRQLQAELEAAGVADDTAVESAQKRLDAANETGDAEQIADAERALKKAEIEEKYAKKKAQLEYKAAVTSWQLQLAIATATGAQAVIGAIAAPPYFPLNAASVALAASIAGLQLAAIGAAKPVAKFAEGGIVPGRSFSGDNVPIAVNSGEMILNREQQGQLFDMLNSGGGKPITITVPLIVDGQQMAVANARYYNNGQVRLDI